MASNRRLVCASKSHMTHSVFSSALASPPHFLQSILPEFPRRLQVRRFFAGSAAYSPEFRRTHRLREAFRASALPPDGINRGRAGFWGVSPRVPRVDIP